MPQTFHLIRAELTKSDAKRKSKRVCMQCRCQKDYGFSSRLRYPFLFELLSSNADLSGETRKEQCILGSVPWVTAFIRLMWCWNCITYNDPWICQRVEGLTLDYVNKTEGIHWRKKRYQVTISDSAEAQERKSCFCLIGFLSSVQWLKLKPVFNLLLYCQREHLERLLLRWPLSECWCTSNPSIL